MARVYPIVVLSGLCLVRAWADADASPIQVCQHLRIASPVDGATEVPIDFIGALTLVSDLACNFPREQEQVVLVDENQVQDVAWIRPFEPLAITPARALQANRRYQLQVRAGEAITSSVSFTTGSDPFVPPVLTAFSLTVDTAEVVDPYRSSTEQRRARWRLDVESLGGNVGPIDVGFGEDEEAAARGLFPMAQGASITRHQGLLLRHVGGNSIDVLLGTEEAWPHPRTCAVVRALARNNGGGCLHPEEGCLLEASRLAACVDSPTGCSATGAPGLEALSLLGLALLAQRRFVLCIRGLGGPKPSS